jgi:hypothetical protein
MNPALSTLFGGTILDGRDSDHACVVLIDSSMHVVRIREMPARHHLEMVDLFDLGREAALLEKCVQVQAPDETTQLGLKWEPATADFIDALTPESHVRLVEIAKALNFPRVIATAERQITSATGLRDLKERMAKTMCAPMLAIMRQEVGSWTSSLTQALSSVLPAKSP